MMLLFFLTVVVVNGQTHCDIQLHNYYVTQGLPGGFPVLPLVNYTTGVLLGVPYVTAVYMFQQVAAIYAANSNTPSPTSAPTGSPTNPTLSPSNSPTVSPTNVPTSPPTNAPTQSPTISPTNAPTNSPTNAPTSTPTKSPTGVPTNPTGPTVAPTKGPSNAPINPTKVPTKSPTFAPTKTPTEAPSKAPTRSPSLNPTTTPSNSPSKAPTKPSSAPSNAPTLVPGQPLVAYLSFDLPWCTSGVIFECVEQQKHAMAKYCTVITDIDEGSPNILNGRFYVYANHSMACNGTVTITLMNTTLVPGNFVANIIYDATGITNYELLNKNDAQHQYQYSDCQYTDGTNASFIKDYQHQFVCLEEQIACVGSPRPPQPATNAVIPVPRFACIDPPDSSNAFQGRMIWFVDSAQTVGVSGMFRKAFMTAAQTSNYYAGIYNPFGLQCLAFNIIYWLATYPNVPTECLPEILEPRTRREFEIFGYGWDSSFLLNYGQVPFYTDWQSVVVYPSFQGTSDPIVSSIPCICCFSYNCFPNGSFAGSNINHPLFIGNSVPLSLAFPGAIVEIPLGSTPTFELNGNQSTDNDNSPFPLHYFWRSLNRTNFSFIPLDLGVGIVDIPNPTSINTTINISLLPSGSYIFVLYVSDCQSIGYSYFNLTILPNVVTVVLPPDFDAELVPCTNTSQPNCIILNGSATYSSNESQPIYYQWQQTADDVGWNLSTIFSPVCNNYSQGIFNTNESVACFVPKYLGLYCVNLTATDNLGSISSGILCVNVIPQAINHTAPNSTIPAFTPPPLRTNPPINRTIIMFDNETGVPLPPSPFSIAPTANVIVPPVIKKYPPASRNGKIVVSAFLILSTVTFCMFVIFWIALRFENNYNYLDILHYSWSRS